MLTLISWVLPASLERCQEGRSKKMTKCLYSVISASYHLLCILYEQSIYNQVSQLHFYIESLTYDLNTEYSKKAATLMYSFAYFRQSSAKVSMINFDNTIYSYMLLLIFGDIYTVSIDLVL